MTLSLYYFFYKVQACLIVIIFTCFCLSSPSSFSFSFPSSSALSFLIHSFYFTSLFLLYSPLPSLITLTYHYSFFALFKLPLLSCIVFSLTCTSSSSSSSLPLSSFSFFSPFLLNCSIYSQLIFHHFLFVWHPVCSHGQYSWDNSPPTALFDYHASHSPSPEQMNLIELSSYLHPRATFHEGTGIHLKHCLMLASPAAIFLTCYLDKAVSLLTLSQIVTLVYW